MGYKYASSLDGKCAYAVGRSLPVSTKQCIEICNWVRGRKLEKAKRLLKDVLEYKQAVPYTRFNGDVGHKKGIGPGRFPQKACSALIELLKSVEANAQSMNLDDSELVISSIVAQRAATSPHNGRRAGRSNKSTHIEVVLRPVVSKKPEVSK